MVEGAVTGAGNVFLHKLVRAVKYARERDVSVFGEGERILECAFGLCEPEKLI